MGCDRTQIFGAPLGSFSIEALLGFTLFGAALLACLIRGPLRALRLLHVRGRAVPAIIERFLDLVRIDNARVYVHIVKALLCALAIKHGRAFKAFHGYLQQNEKRGG